MDCGLLFGPHSLLCPGRPEMAPWAHQVIATQPQALGLRGNEWSLRGWPGKSGSIPRDDGQAGERSPSVSEMTSNCASNASHVPCLPHKGRCMPAWIAFSVQLSVSSRNEATLLRPLFTPLLILSHPFLYLEISLVVKALLQLCVFHGVVPDALG